MNDLGGVSCSAFINILCLSPSLTNTQQQNNVYEARSNHRVQQPYKNNSRHVVLQICLKQQEHEQIVKL